MRQIYVDNFRGFSDTFIPLEQVNFLVGENSTGKTSLLGLLHLLSSSSFWFFQKFNDEVFKFGHFKDIVSIHSKNQDCFSFGVIESSKSPGGELFNGILMSFYEEEGLPRLARASFSMNNMLVELWLNKNEGSYYKRSKVVASKTLEEFKKKNFKRWVRSHRKRSSDSTQMKREKIELSLALKEPMSPYFLLTYMQRHIEGLKKENKEKEGGKQKKSSERFFEVLSYIVPLMPVPVWLAPIRSKPSKTYDDYTSDFSPEGSHTPYLIKKLLGSKDKARKFKSFIRRVGKASGLFETVKIKSYGESVISPFELHIVIDKKAINISYVGYGVSQSLPVIVEIVAQSARSLFAIQQPEVHLHPRAQAALGDILFELAVIEKKSFFVETHSDFTIDRFRLNYRTKRKNKPNAQILFFERSRKKNTVTALPIGTSGELPADQPAKYRDFFLKEQMELLGL